MTVLEEEYIELLHLLGMKSACEDFCLVVSQKADTIPFVSCYTAVHFCPMIFLCLPKIKTLM